MIKLGNPLRTPPLRAYFPIGKFVDTIIRNFDIVQHVTSSLATVVGPTTLNQSERSHGFTVSNAGEELPVIGIIDTGISSRTPLAPLIINSDERLNLTDASIRDDTANHGTATAALAAFGKHAYGAQYRGGLEAHARLLSIKVMDVSAAPLSQQSVINLLYTAKNQYPQVRLFVLTICIQAFKKQMKIILRMPLNWINSLIFTTALFLFVRAITLTLQRQIPVITSFILKKRKQTFQFRRNQ